MLYETEFNKNKNLSAAPFGGNLCKFVLIRG